MLKKQNKPLAILMLIAFLAALFAHSGHFSIAKLDGVSSVEQHECFLCQQALDSATKDVNLAFSSVGVFSAINVEVNHVYIVLPAYLFAQLRAPPLAL